MKIEERFEEIDKIIEGLERNEATLDESIDLYIKGMDIIKECNKEIDKVEKQLIVLGEEDEEQ